MQLRSPWLLGIWVLLAGIGWARPVWARQDPAPVPQTAIDAAIDRGAAYLGTQQELDGSWRFESNQHVGAMTGFAVYTLLQAGWNPEHQAVQRGLRFLDNLQPRSTYEAACMILAYGSADSERYAPRLQAITDQLLEWHRGVWAYPWSVDDVSNTHFGSLGLRYAQQVGCRVPEDAWEDTAKSMLRWQAKDGSFCYRQGGEATLSMTAAGLGILCMAREGLQRTAQDKKPSRQVRELEEGLEKGLAWMASVDSIPHGNWEGNSGHRRWDYYYLYGLQRVGVLAPTETIAGKPWYQDGARWLIQKQAKDGHWATAYGEAQPNTCLAILFLKRASTPLSGKTASHLYVVKVEDPEADVQIIATGQNPTRVWLRAIHPLIYDSWEWPDEVGQGLRIRKVEYWSEDRLLATVPGDPETPAKDLPYATEIQFTELRTHPLRARVYLAPPPGDPDPEPWVESPEILVEYSNGLEDWQAEYSSARGRNLLLQTKVQVRTSSQLNDHWSSGKLIDGLQGTGWICAQEDETPTITLDLKKAQTAQRIWLSHAVENPTKPGLFAKAKTVHVTVNKRKPLVVELDPREDRKMLIELPRKERVRRLEIEIVERQPGSQHERAAGFMEIELE